MITIDAERGTFTIEVVRKALWQLRNHRPSWESSLDEHLKRCLWIVSLNAWAQLENSCVFVDAVVVLRKSAAPAMDMLKESPVHKTIYGAPVYRTLSGGLGLPDNSESDVLLLAIGDDGPEVLLRITNLSMHAIKIPETQGQGMPCQ